MQVVLSGRREEKLKEVAAACNGNAHIEILDVANKDDVLAVVERIKTRLGRIDVMVASAGINVKNRNWHNVTLEDWDSVIRIDLDGAFYCCKAVLPVMQAQEDGSDYQYLILGRKTCQCCHGTRIYCCQARDERDERES